MHNMPNIEADDLQLQKATLGSSHLSQEQQVQIHQNWIIEDWTKATCFFILHQSHFSDTVQTAALASSSQLTGMQSNVVFCWYIQSICP